MIVVAPASRAPAMAASPTPPQPNTATESPRPTSPVSIAAPRPGHHAAAEQAGHLRLHLRRHLRALAGGHERLLGEGADARAPATAATPSSVIFCVALKVVKQYQGRPAAARPALAAHRPPVEDHEVAGRDVGDVGPDRLDHAGRLVAEQERELVVDAALAVVQVGVAHAARLHLHERLAGTGVGHLDHLDGHRLLDGLGHHRTHLLRHR